MIKKLEPGFIRVCEFTVSVSSCLTNINRLYVNKEESLSWVLKVDSCTGGSCFWRKGSEGKTRSTPGHWFKTIYPYVYVECPSQEFIVVSQKEKDDRPDYYTSDLSLSREFDPQLGHIIPTVSSYDLSRNQRLLTWR